MSLVAASLWSLAAVVGLATAVWIVSLLQEDASLVDLFWGPFFALQAWIHRFASPSGGLAADLALTLVTAWALRLALHLARRNLGKGEDRRYAEMRDEGGEGWPVRSLVTVFWLQAGLSWLIAWPLVVAVRAGGDPGWVGWIGMGVALVGLGVEATADRQLRRFKADPTNRGQVMDRGLWRYSRHPNYFGDAVFWWGIFVLAVDAGGAWTVFGPVLMTLLLLKVSGVPLLESHLEETRPGYREYVRRTPAFVPWFPKEEG